MIEQVCSSTRVNGRSFAGCLDVGRYGVDARVLENSMSSQRIAKRTQHMIVFYCCWYKSASLSLLREMDGKWLRRHVRLLVLLYAALKVVCALGDVEYVLECLKVCPCVCVYFEREELWDR